MQITGIICEYNPFHLGHARQLSLLRQQMPQGGIVCLMSGNFVQRGAPAIFDKGLRAAAAIDCGADLVLELPVTAALSSAEGFAAEGVRILNGFCHSLSFGAETPDRALFMRTAEILLREDFREYLRSALTQGCSFPAARQKAALQMGIDSDLLSKPNNILAVEYCKAIIASNASISPQPIQRTGSYHNTLPDPVAPSATAVREQIMQNRDWTDYIPPAAYPYFRDACVHSLSPGEAAVLYRLRTMTDDEFLALPFGSEGLWRKLMKNSRQFASLEQILTATKSKRYTRTRLDRMVMCAFLGLTQQDLQSPAPYVRVLALNSRGRSILNIARSTGEFPNIGQNIHHPFQHIENRCDDLYGLFSHKGPEPSGITAQRRIYVQTGEEL